MIDLTPFVIGLTGGIASGKTAVAERFKALGVHVYDADVAAREVVAPGTPGLQSIIEVFGRDVLQPDGSLDRRAMRARIFQDEQARAALESIVHPQVRQWLTRRIAADTGPYCLVAIPLLAETWPQYAWVNRVLVVDAPDAVRIERLVRRDAIDADLARSMLAAQASRERRLDRADDVIDNSGTPDQLDTAVTTLHRKYQALAANRA